MKCKECGHTYDRHCSACPYCAEKKERLIGWCPHGVLKNKECVVCESDELRGEIERLKSQWTSVPEQYDDYADFVADLIDEASKFDAEFAVIFARVEKAEADNERLRENLKKSERGARRVGRQRDEDLQSRDRYQRLLHNEHDRAEKAEADNDHLKKKLQTEFENCDECDKELMLAKDEAVRLREETERLDKRVAESMREHAADVRHMSGWDAVHAPDDVRAMVGQLRERVEAYVERETRADALEKTVEAVRDRLYIAESYLAEGGCELPDGVEDSRLQKAEAEIERLKEWAKPTAQDPTVYNVKNSINAGYALAKKEARAILDGEGEKTHCPRCGAEYLPKGGGQCTACTAVEVPK